MPAAWNRGLRIAIGILHTGWVSTAWAIRLVQVLRKMPPGVRWGLALNKSLPIDIARDDLVRQAQKKDCTHILFLDSDVLPPTDLFPRMVKNAELPVVAALYYGKKDGGRYPLALVEGEKDGKPASLPIEVDPPGLYEVDYVGMGCTLIRMDLFERLEPPWFYFSYLREGDKEMGVSEDFHWCLRVKSELKEKVYVDTEIRCDHLALAAIHEGKLYIMGGWE